jgi:hypothetical protein
MPSTPCPPSKWQQEQLVPRVDRHSMLARQSRALESQYNIAKTVADHCLWGEEDNDEKIFARTPTSRSISPCCFEVTSKRHPLAQSESESAGDVCEQKPLSMSPGNADPSGERVTIAMRHLVGSKLLLAKGSFANEPNFGGSYCDRTESVESATAKQENREPFSELDSNASNHPTSDPTDEEYNDDSQSDDLSCGHCLAQGLSNASLMTCRVCGGTVCVGCVSPCVRLGTVRPSRSRWATEQLIAPTCRDFSPVQLQTPSRQDSSPVQLQTPRPLPPPLTTAHTTAQVLTPDANCPALSSSHSVRVHNIDLGPWWQDPHWTWCEYRQRYVYRKLRCEQNRKRSKRFSNFG